MKIEQILVGEMANFTYILSDNKEKQAIIIDPSWNLESIFNYLNENKLSAKLIINTHSHFDHVLGNDEVSKKTGALILQHHNSPLKKDKELIDGQIMNFGDSVIKIIHTPGHSKDSICLILNNVDILTGDTLFVGSCGRLDLPGGDPREMYDSIYNKMKNLDEKLVVYPGHHYGSTKTSTIKDEKMTNFVFKFKNLQEFLNFMNR